MAILTCISGPIAFFWVYVFFVEAYISRRSSSLFLSLSCFTPCLTANYHLIKSTFFDVPLWFADKMWPALPQYNYIFAIGTFFALLDAYNNGASKSFPQVNFLGLYS